MTKHDVQNSFLMVCVVGKLQLVQPKAWQLSNGRSSPCMRNCQHCIYQVMLSPNHDMHNLILRPAMALH